MLPRRIFLHFNSLIENQSQVVISSDRSPNDLDRSRPNKVKIVEWPCCRHTAARYIIELEILKKRLAEKDRF